MKPIPREICRDIGRALSHEWIVSNGKGGYAAGTIAGALTRREHGLLVIPSEPSARTVLLAKIDEELEMEGQLYKLGTNVYSDNVINPDGFLYLQQVTFDGAIPTFAYEAGRFRLTKTIWMAEDQTTTYVRYALAEHSAPARLTLLPFCDYRATDQVTQGSETRHFRVEIVERGFRVTAYEGAQPYRITTEPSSAFTPLDLWYWRLQLRANDNVVTDLYMPGLFRVELQPGMTLTIVATAEKEQAVELDIWRSLERARQRPIPAGHPAPDQFTSEFFHVIR